MDLHEAGGTGISLWMPEHPFEIPLRCLIPEATPGLVVTGRAISATRSANGGSRHMGTAMALGEASGVLAARCAELGVEPAEVDPGQVRASLRRNGALASLEELRADPNAEAALTNP